MDAFTFGDFQIEEPEVKKIIIDIQHILNYFSELKKPIVKRVSPRELLKKPAPAFIDKFILLGDC